MVYKSKLFRMEWALFQIQDGIQSYCPSQIFTIVNNSFAGVGKSCLLLQFTDKRFQPVHDLTIGELNFLSIQSFE